MTGSITARRRSRSARAPTAGAQQLGISTVYQEVNLCPNLSVAENIFAGRQPRRPWTRGGGIDWRELNRARASCCAGSTSTSTCTRALGVVLGRRAADGGHRARASTSRRARADPRRAHVEPRQRRSRPAVRRHPRGCATTGMAILFVTHFLDQVYAISRPHHGAAQRPAGRRIPPAKLDHAGAGGGDGGPRGRAEAAAISAPPRRDTRSTARRAGARPRAARPASTAVDLELQARRGAGPRRLVGLGPHRSSRGCCSGSTDADAGEHRASNGEARRLDDPAQAIAPGPRRSARKSARPRASSRSCPCARTSCWRCRRAWACTQLPLQRRRRSPMQLAEATRRRAPRQDREHRNPIGAAVRRQPAEVPDRRALARHPAAPADPRRAHARHRRGRQAGDHERDARARTPAAWRVLFISAEIDEVVRVSRPHRGDARPRQGRRACRGGAPKTRSTRCIARHGEHHDPHEAPPATPAVLAAVALAAAADRVNAPLQSGLPRAHLARRAPVRQRHRHPEPRGTAHAGRRSGMTLVIAVRGLDISVGAVVAIAAARGRAGDRRQLQRNGDVQACRHRWRRSAPRSRWLRPAALWNGAAGGQASGMQPIVATLILMVAGRGIAQLLTGGQIITVYYAPYVLHARQWLPAGPAVRACASRARSSALLHLRAHARRSGCSCAPSASIRWPRAIAGVRSRPITLCAVRLLRARGRASPGSSSAPTSRAPTRNNAGQLLELDAILAVTLGGTALTGGRFTLAGTVIGALIIQTLTSTIYSLGVPPEVNLVCQGGAGVRRDAAAVAGVPRQRRGADARPAQESLAPARAHARPSTRRLRSAGRHARRCSSRWSAFGAVSLRRLPGAAGVPEPGHRQRLPAASSRWA